MLSLEQVARAAGVSRSTVYLIFGSRAGLLDALTTDLWWNRAGFQHVVDAAAHPDAREHLRSGIDAGSACSLRTGTSSARCSRWLSWTATP